MVLEGTVVECLKELGIDLEKDEEKGHEKEKLYHQAAIEVQ